jgi:hypothetical protein
VALGLEAGLVDEDAGVGVEAGEGAGATLDGFEGIFDLEDVAIGGEDCGLVSWCGG